MRGLLIDLLRYYATVSTPSRAALLAVRNLSVDVEVRKSSGKVAKAAFVAQFG